MTHSSTVSALLPLALPADSDRRQLLLTFRRMALHGLDDAHATWAMIERFGLGYHTPLVLMRRFLSELASASLRPITMAPCCCPRMTLDEARLLSVVARANAEPDWARFHLERLTGGAGASQPLSVAMALNDTFAERGRPLPLSG